MHGDRLRRFLLLLLLINGSFVIAMIISSVYSSIMITGYTKRPNMYWPKKHKMTVVDQEDQQNKRSSLIIDQERKNISSDIIQQSTFPFPLSKYIPEKGGIPIRVLVVSTWRSGSTFLGNLLMSSQPTFYHYEPLQTYGIRRLRDMNLGKTGEAMKKLHQLFSCNYTSMDEYLNHFCGFRLKYNHRFWVRGCEKGKKYEQCCKSNFIERFCSLYPFQVMKTVRLSLKPTERFLVDPLFSDRTKIILLVRDPRGTISSRQSKSVVRWCSGERDCDTPQRLCGDLETDYHTAVSFSQKYPDSFMVVRYEDMALSVFDYSEKILGFIGQEFNPRVNRFLKSHAEADEGNWHSTYRNSKKTPFRWKQSLSFQEVVEIQKSCTRALKLWGYNVANKEAEYKSLNPLRNFTLNSNDNNSSL